MKRLVSFGIFSFFFAFALLTSFTHAAPAWIIEHPDDAGDLVSGLGLLHFINNLTNWMFVGFMILGIAVLVFTGFQFISSQGNPENVRNARKKLLWAFIAIGIGTTSKGIPIVIASILGVGSGGGSILPPLPPIVAITASSPAVIDGNPITLNWSVSHAASCTALGDWSIAVAPAAGTHTTPALTGIGTTKTYTLECTGPGGTVSSSAPVLVTQLPIPPTIAYWNFNQGAGATLSDSVGGHTGTLALGAGGNTSTAGAWVTGKNGVAGTAISFDGIDDYTTVGVNNLGSIPDSFTIAAWIKLNSNVGSQAILSEYKFGLCGDPIFGINASRVYFHDGSASVPSTILGNTSISINQWHYVAVVSTPSNVHVYLDGNPDGSLTDLDWRNVCSYDVRIGNIGTNDFNFNGQMDDLKMWDKALTPAEIAADYAAGPS